MTYTRVFPALYAGERFEGTYTDTDTQQSVADELDRLHGPFFGGRFEFWAHGKFAYIGYRD